jgi:DNA-binding transcriptional LysR family regulator
VNLHKLRVFREVVEHQSLSLAAQRLIVSQPVVSAHVRDLESFFGAKLLHQRGRRMIPTEAGEMAYQCALEILRSIDETVSLTRLLESGEAGRARVGANMNPGTYTLPAQLTAFKLLHQAVEISLELSDSETIYDQTRRGVYDFSVVVAPELPPDLDAEIQSYERLVIVASPLHPLAGQSNVTPRDLASEQFVCSPPSESRRKLIDVQLADVGLPRRDVVMTLGHPEGVKQAVRAGIGLAVLFYCSVERELRDGVLAEVALDGPVLQHPFYLIFGRRKYFSPVQRQLLDFLRQAGNRQAGNAAATAPRVDRDATGAVSPGDTERATRRA